MKLLKLTDVNLLKLENKDATGWDSWIENLEIFCSKTLICNVFKGLASVIIAGDETLEIESKIVRLNNLMKTANLSRSQQKSTKDFTTLANKLYIKIISRIIKSVNKYFDNLLMPKMSHLVPILQSSSILEKT